MGYNARSELVFGIRFTEEETKFVESNFNYDERDCLYYSGDGRGEMYSPVLGALLVSGFDWG